MQELENIAGFELSPQQKRLWQLEGEKALSPDRVQGVVLIQGELDISLLEKALQAVVSHYEILRSQFVSFAGMNLPLQVINSHSCVALQYSDSPVSVNTLIQELQQTPLEIREGKVFQGKLVKVDSNQHLLGLTISAFCADLITLETLVEEVAETYTRYCNSQAVTPEEALQYADIAAWQNEIFAEAEAEVGRNYWRKQEFANSPLDLKAKEAENSSFSVDTVVIPVESFVFQQLKLLSQQQSIELSTLLLGIWYTFCVKLTGKPQQTIATYFNGRNYEELISAIGTLGKYLPVTAELEGSVTFLEAIELIQKSYAEAETWQEFFTWDDLNTNLSFFPYSFEFHSTPPAYTSGNLIWTWEQQESCGDRFQLQLRVVQTQDTLILALNYDKQLYSQTDIQHLGEQLQTLLKSSVTNPQSAIAALEILTASDRQKLYEFNCTSVEYSTDISIHQVFEAQVKQTPNHIAAVYNTIDQFSATSITYIDLNTKANQLAHYLQQRGVKPETLVGLYVERSVNMIIGILGILKAGGTYIPLDPTLPAEGLAFRLQDSQLAVVLTQSSLSEKLPKTAADIIELDTEWENIAESSQDNPNINISPDSLAYILYTSGSSGQPKGVAVEHRQLLNYSYSIQDRLQLKSGFSYGLVSTFAADLGNTMIFPCLFTGGCLHILSPDTVINPSALANYCRQYPLDCLKIVPSHLKALLTSQEAATFLPRQRLVLGGEALDWRLIPQIQDKLAPSCQIFNHYGPTETTVGVLTYLINGTSIDSKTVPLGRPLANNQIYLLNTHLQPVPMGVVGEVYIGGNQVARGYWNRPELTAERFIENSLNPGTRLYKTGDLARYLPDGNIEFIGRCDRQIKLNGFRIELGEIEAKIQQHLIVQDAVVLVKEDEAKQKKLVAYIVPITDNQINIPELVAFLQTQLPDYMIPAAFISLASLPLTANGKIDYSALPVPNFNRNSEGYVAPRTEIEQVLAQIWSEILGIERVGIYDNFFRLGGDSILSIQAIAKATQLGIKLTPRQLFQYQTIAELSQVTEIVNPAIETQELVTGDVPLTPIQLRFFAQQLTNFNHWNQAVFLEAKQAIDFNILQQAVAEIIQHHDALRLQFTQTELIWQQRYTEFNSNIACTLVNLANIPKSEQTTIITEKADQIQASFNIAKPPLIQVVLFDLGSHQNSQLLIVIHHLAVDGVSWRILLKDLQTAYQQIAAAKTVKLPAKTNSFQQWSQHLQNYANSPAIQQEINIWKETLSGNFTQLPIDSDGINSINSTQTLLITLTPEETHALLHKVPHAYSTQINDILLTALGQTLATWTNSTDVLIDLESHGREPLFDGMNLTETVGWFTSIFPVKLKLETQDNSNSGTIIKNVKEQLRQIPNHGIGYGILQYLAKAEVLPKVSVAQVSFNYLGQLDGTLSKSALFQLSDRTVENTRDPQGIRNYLLEINSFVRQGQLQFHWIYSSAIYRENTIKQLTQKYLENLRSLIHHCQSVDKEEYTPSDFPNANLNQGDLNKLMTRLHKSIPRFLTCEKKCLG